MYKKKIGVFSVISIVIGILALIFSIMSLLGAPFYISLILGGVSIICGIIALILKNKVVVPVVGMVLSVIAILASLGIVIVSNIDYKVDLDDNFKSKKESSEQKMNDINNNSVNELYNINNTTSTNNIISTNIIDNTIIANEINTNTTNTTNNTTSSQRVGNSEVGYVTVPSNWTKFYDSDSPSGTFQYSYANVYIITLFAVESNGISAETYAKYLESELKDEGSESITLGTSTVGKYNAYKVQCYYSDENIWLDCYYFETEDGKMHYIAMEGPDKNSEYFKIPNTFSIKE